MQNFLYDSIEWVCILYKPWRLPRYLVSQRLFGFSLLMCINSLSELRTCDVEENSSSFFSLYFMFTPQVLDISNLPNYVTNTSHTHNLQNTLPTSPLPFCTKVLLSLTQAFSPLLPFSTPTPLIFHPPTLISAGLSPHVLIHVIPASI